MLPQSGLGALSQLWHVLGLFRFLQAPLADGGAGGAGKAYTIADGTSPVFYAGGGGGMIYNSGAGSSSNGGQGGGGGEAQDAQANKGGGGGGGHSSGTGGQGGKGIVIVRY